LRKLFYILAILLFAVDVWSATYWVKGTGSGPNYVTYSSNSDSGCSTGDWTPTTDLEAVLTTIDDGNTVYLCDEIFTDDERDSDGILNFPKNQTIIGIGSATLKMDDGGNLHRVARITGRDGLVLQNIIFDANGDNQTAGYNYPCDISGATQNLTITGCTFKNATDGALNENTDAQQVGLHIGSAYGGTVNDLIQTSIFQNCGAWGIRVSTNDDVITLDNNTVSDCSGGITGVGTGSLQCDSLTISNNTVTGWIKAPCIKSTAFIGNDLVVTGNYCYTPADEDVVGAVDDGYQMSFASATTGFSFTNNRYESNGADGDYGMVFNLVNGQTATITDNYVFGAPCTCFYVSGGDAATITRNRLVGCGDDATCGARDGIYLYINTNQSNEPAESHNIYGNVVDDCYGGVRMAGLEAYDRPSGNKIVNNLFLNLTGIGLETIGYVDSDNIFKNNIITLASGEYVNLATNGVFTAGYIDTNLYYGGDGSGDWTSAGSGYDTLVSWNGTTGHDGTNSQVIDPSLSGYCPDESDDPGVDLGAVTGISGQTDFYGKFPWNTIDIGACELYFGRTGMKFDGIQQ